MVASLSKQFGEERIVAPLALLPYHVHREQIFEHKAGKVPWRHHIGKLHQSACSLALHLSGCGFLHIAILLRVVAVIAFANDEHYLRRGKLATVYLHLVGSTYQLLHLVGGKLVGIDAEGQSPDGQIQFGMSRLGQGVFYLAYAFARH